jgi:hypothetical protein
LKSDARLLMVAACSHPRGEDELILTTRRRIEMKERLPIAACLWILIIIAGCASTKLSNRDEYEGGKLPRPDHIWVHDFVATRADLPADSVLAGQDLDHDKSQTPQQIETGRKLGAEIAAALVAEIRGMGMPAERASNTTKPQVNDLIIRGYLISVNKGSETKRIAIGLGDGSSELKTAVEGFQMTAQGPRKLGSGDLDASGGKSPGAGVGLAMMLATHNPVGLIVSTGVKVYGEESGKATIGGRAHQTAKEIGDQLKIKFQEQGWI